MSDEIASHELRNDTAGVLRRVQAGERLAVTVNGHHVADLVPAQRSRRGWIRRDVIVARLRRAQADPGLREDLAWIAAESGRPLDERRIPDEVTSRSSLWPNC